MSRIILVISLILLGACSSVQVEDYAGTSPTFDPREFFRDSLTAHGVVMNRGGKVTRHFNAQIEASWDGGVGTLDEDFIFDDGETQKRVWTLTPDGSGGYICRAGDVVGDGILSHAGNAVFLKYVLRVPYGDGTIDVTVDDRMYRVSPDVVINESRLSKFGVNVGRILLTIVRHPEENKT